MIWHICINVAFSFLATLAYAVLFNAPRDQFIHCGCMGMIGWSTYAFMNQYLSVSLATFLATMIVVLVARMLTVRRKCPMTVFLVCGIIPLVPGAGMYFTAYYLVSGQFDMATVRGLESIKIAFAIVLGIALVVSVPREAFWFFGKQKRADKRQESLVAEQKGQEEQGEGRIEKDMDIQK